MKKIISMLLVLMVAFSLASCGRKVTLDDAEEILKDNPTFSINEDGSASAWVMLYDGTSHSRENKSVIADLEDIFGTPSYNELWDLCEFPNKSKYISCENIDIEITSLPTKNSSKIISIRFEENP